MNLWSLLKWVLHLSGQCPVVYGGDRQCIRGAGHPGAHDNGHHVWISEGEE